MHTSPQLGLRLPDLTVDAPDVPDWLQKLALDIEATLAPAGLLADRPTSTSGTPGRLGRRYFATDDGPDGTLYFDTGTRWVAIGPAAAAGLVTTSGIADGAVTDPKVASGISGAKIADGTLPTVALADKAVTAAKVADALKPSAGAGASTEALRALGTSAGQAAAGTHAAQHAAGGADPLSGITRAQLASDVTSGFADVGDVKAVAYPVTAGSEPTGWLLCDGRNVSRTTYAALFAKIGTTYGAGDNVNTFGLPDGRGRGIIGAGQGTSLTNRAVGAKGGAETVTLTPAQLPAHSHLYQGEQNGGAGAQVALHFSKNVALDSTFAQNYPDGSTGLSDRPQGQSHENMPPFLVLTYLIKAT